MEFTACGEWNNERSALTGAQIISAALLLIPFEAKLQPGAAAPKALVTQTQCLEPCQAPFIPALPSRGDSLSPGTSPCPTEVPIGAGGLAQSPGTAGFVPEGFLSSPRS